jgi:hypothetical protein
MIRGVERLRLVLTALPVLAAGLLSGCNPGCSTPSATTTTGAAAVSTCDSGTASTASGYGISGGVSGPALPGVLINLTGAAVANASTDANGNYGFTGLASGNYTLVPSLAGYTFRPASTVVTVSGGNVSGSNFTETAYAQATSGLSGSASGAVAQNVTITLSGANNGTALTDASGNYTFSGLAAGSYMVTPSLAGYIFSPASIAVTTISGGNAGANNFAAAAYAAATSSLSGTVSGAVAQNVTITLSGANTGTVVTDANGNYSISGLAAGSYTLTPSLAGYTFSPASNAVTTIGGANTSVGNFTAAL